MTPEQKQTIQELQDKVEVEVSYVYPRLHREAIMMNKEDDPLIFEKMKEFINSKLAELYKEIDKITKPKDN